jgi:nickel-dependent lactate racemase
MEWSELKLPDAVIGHVRPGLQRDEPGRDHLERPQALARGPGADARALLERAGFPAFAVAAKAAGEMLTLVVNDTHRFTDTRSFLGAVFSILDSLPVAGAQPGVRMLVAAGSHKSDELERAGHEERMAAPYLARFAEIEWHDSDAGDLVKIGAHEFHRWMSGGGYYLACGSMEPHYFAGVTGAHKTLTVGVMSRRSIERNHEAAMSPDVAPLKLERNPVHEGVLDALRTLEADGAHLLALNQLIVDGRVAAATAGHPVAALHDGLGLVRAWFGHRVSRPLDLVVARVGAPLDRDLYQADKGIKNTEAAVRDGGVLVLEAECAHGIGIRHFVDLLETAPTHAAACEIVARRGYRLGDHKAVRLRALTDNRRVRVALVTRSIDASMARVLGMSIFHDRNSAAAWVREQLAGVAAVHGLVVEDAGNLALEVAG